MKYLFAFFVILTSSPTAEGKDEWTSLFDGKTLNGWSSTSDANWRIESGTIVVDEGEGGLLLHEDTYRNYELVVEFKAARGTNSGVFLSTREKPKSLTRDCYELNIAPPDNAFPTGSLVAREKVEGAGESDAWRKFEIRVKDGKIEVKLDGKILLNHQANPPAEGAGIGLQKNSGRVAFRNIRVKKLP